MENESENYRSLLVQTWQKTQDDFDKAVLSLSGGALGVSFIFLKDIVGPQPIQKAIIVFGAWICWALSSTATLVSFLTSKRAIWKEILALDHPVENVSKPSANRLTRAWQWCKSARGLDVCTTYLNSCASILFFIGVILMVIFTSYNLEALMHARQK